MSWIHQDGLHQSWISSLGRLPIRETIKLATTMVRRVRACNMQLVPFFNRRYLYRELRESKIMNKEQGTRNVEVEGKYRSNYSLPRSLFLVPCWIFTMFLVGYTAQDPGCPIVTTKPRGLESGVL